MPVGQQVELNVVVRDARNNVLAGRRVEWSSSNPSIASIDPSSGVVSGQSVGQAQITARLGSLTATATVSVVASGAPAVQNVAPDTLVEGQHAAIRGLNFDPDPQQNVVLVGGARANVLAATPSELQIVVPLGCYPRGPVEVQVRVRGTQSNTIEHPARGGPALQLSSGEQAILRSPEQLCVRLDPSNTTESYLVGIQSVSEVLATLTPVEMRGLRGAADGGAAPATGAAPFIASRTVRPFALQRPRSTDQRSLRWRSHRLAETRLRAWEQKALSPVETRLLRQRMQRTSVARSLSLAQTAAVTVGDTLDLRFPNIAGDICREFVPVRAVARFVGARGIFLEDVDNPAGGFDDADYALLSQQFDQTIYPTNVAYFGEPTDLDANDRMLILTTKEINRFNAEGERSILGFVFGGDLTPRGDPPGGCPSSNFAEIYYGIAPDPAGEAGPAYSRASALEDAPLLVAHEVAHIIQFGRRIYNPAATTLQTIWEMEGQATLAEEVVGHAATGRAPRNDYGAQVAFEGWDENDPRTPWYLSGIIDHVLYFGLDLDNLENKVPGAPEQCSWVGIDWEEGNNGPCFAAQRLAYGISWSFLRWASDHFGPGFSNGEQGIHRALIDNATMAGFANISTVLGEPIDRLLAQWAAALYVDNRIPTAAPRLTVPSWNFFDIFEESLIPSARLQPRQRGFGGFADALEVRAASAGYFLVSGPGRRHFAISALSLAGEPLPAHMQLWIVRLQ